MRLLVAYTALLKSVIKNGVVGGFVASLLVAYAVLSIAGCVVSLSRQEALAIAGSAARSHYVVSAQEVPGCIKVGVLNASICFREVCVTTWQYMLDENAAAALGLFQGSAPPAYPDISAGYLLAEYTGVRVGDVVTVCTELVCRKARVVSIHRGAFGESIVTTPGEPGRNVCLSENRELALDIAKGLAGDLSRAMQYAGLVASLLYLPVLVVACFKLHKELSTELEVLVGLGAPRAEVAAAFALVAASLALFSAVLGLSLGTVAFHASLWFLKFTGVHVPYRPLPDLGAVLAPALVLAAVATVASLFIGLRGGFVEVAY